MAIITISRGSYSMGTRVAEKVAERLGYSLTSRDVLLEASKNFHIPELKLARAIHDAPSVLDRFTHGRIRFVAFIKSALTSLAVADNIVYHGLAGHLLLQGIPHVFKVRIIADLEARVEAEMDREGISYREAHDLILKDDTERRKWTQILYGLDPWDASLYDLVIHIHKLTVDDAVDFIVQAVKRDCFKTTPQSQTKMKDLALACRIKALLVEDGWVDVAVTSQFGNVLVYTKLDDRRAQELERKIKALAKGIENFNHVEVRSGQPFPAKAC